ncbi:hypothetical protein A2773_04705 [Candidatus Gottesmanbacteria bacterium RIFCSPHIGHO2_01_FULL_39_10]|uniref:YprB ribonuclease H-like domain-containing protein n=1 Tax=Candidatus Gottesmanbacteria bacterium RIFCSPHIGHO2_01_FULL_39_10 TaxID=1798375 RepID=A0A1F5ZRW9_9BACT|nr:MAG: hypothetical protein A2773_04705 [Candidatus Gottesmanbacteria bacterium RIFCSPHIGHO2_01_FULL_39_10]
MKPIVLDIETQNLFTEVGYDHKKLKVSVVGIYDYATGTYETYLEKDLGLLFKKLEHTSQIIGFNINKFDLPVLSPYYIGDLSKIPTLDLLDQVHKILGFRLALDDLARATLGVKKSGHGLLAIDLYRNNKIDELCQYCLSDVKITKELYEYGLKEKKLYFQDTHGKREIPVSWDIPKASNSSLELTLPI